MYVSLLRKFSPGTDDEKHQKPKPNTPQDGRELVENDEKDEQRDKRKEEEDQNHLDDDEPPVLDLLRKEDTEEENRLVMVTRTENGTTGYLNTSGNHSYTL